MDVGRIRVWSGSPQSKLTWNCCPSWPRLRRMKSLVSPELPTASVGSWQATTAAVDNSAPLATRPESTYKSGKVVQTNGATSHCTTCMEDLPAHKDWCQPQRAA